MKIKNEKDVTIIIVTYKSTHIILQTLKNITNKGYRIIIVDNGSNDNIKDLLKQNYPNSEVELILLDNNYGFGRANNIALETTKTNYALILNPDAIINCQSIDNLAIECNKDQNIALANPITAPKEKCSKEDIEKEFKDYKEKIKIIKENKNTAEVNFICGGYMLMNMNIFRKIGFFDKNIFLYNEDVELSQRSINNGYKNILVKNSYIFHHGQKSTKVQGKLEQYRMLYFRQWHQGWSKTYLKIKKYNYFKIWLKTTIQFLSVFLYILILDKKHATIRLARSFGSFSNLFGIDCFNTKNHKCNNLKYK